MSTNVGLPQQKVPGEPARMGAISQGHEADNKQLLLIKSSGGKRRNKTKRRKQSRKIKGGTGSGGNSPSTISPPIVPNTGGTSDTRNTQQLSYNQLAGLSASVNANSKYDKVGGRRRKKSRKSRKYTKRRKYY